MQLHSSIEIKREKKIKQKYKKAKSMGKKRENVTLKARGEGGREKGGKRPKQEGKRWRWRELNTGGGEKGLDTAGKIRKKI